MDVVVSSSVLTVHDVLQGEAVVNDFYLGNGWMWLNIGGAVIYLDESGEMIIFKVDNAHVAHVSEGTYALILDLPDDDNRG